MDPLGSVEGLPKLPFELGIVRYDDPPPDRLEEGDLERLCEAGAFREANHLAAWIEVEDGKVVDYGQLGEAFVGSTKFGLGRTEIVVPRVAFESIRPNPKVRGGCCPLRPDRRRPRRVPGASDGGGEAVLPRPLGDRLDDAIADHRRRRSSYHSLAGASPFPRHWIYDRHGLLVEKSGTIDFRGWWREAHRARTPWGDEDSETFVTAAETAFERELSRDLMTSGAVPERRTLEPDETLVQQGEPGAALFLLVDGVLAAEVDGKEVAEIGPGAIVGERAAFAGGTRTATLYARTRCRVAVIASDVIDPQELEDLAEARRET